MSNQAAALVMLPSRQDRHHARSQPARLRRDRHLRSVLFIPHAARTGRVLIFTPGRYRFFDFVKVGSILTVAVFAVVMLLVPTFWPLQQSADLSVHQAATPDPLTLGQNATYITTVTNKKGSDTARSVKVTNNLPEALTFISCAATGGGVCEGSGNNHTVTFPSLAGGQSATITIVATVKDTLPAGTVIENTATATSPTVDEDQSDNSATATSKAYN